MSSCSPRSPYLPRCQRHCAVHPAHSAMSSAYGDKVSRKMLECLHVRRGRTRKLCRVPCWQAPGRACRATGSSPAPTEPDSWLFHSQLRRYLWTPCPCTFSRLWFTFSSCHVHFSNFGWPRPRTHQWLRLPIAPASHLRASTHANSRLGTRHLLFPNPSCCP